jgi:uncharacterized membrane protein YvbJ
MKYCRKCGSPNRDAAPACETCGEAFLATPSTFMHAPPPTAAAALKPEDRRWIFLGNLCLSPILGLVLYLVWKDSHKAKAQEVCKLTWWTLAIWGGFIILVMLVAIISET